MKKMMILLTALLSMAVSANAMSYAQAREQALFLTDKMAYELNLNDAQYEAAYEINLDYLMNIDDRHDLYGDYWTRRNLDLSYILLDWQYRAFCSATYFYRPLYWDAGFWHFAIYARYPHRDYFYFGRPHFVTVYRGGHSWHHNGGRSWYRGRDFGARPSSGNHKYLGMRDRFDRGDFGKGVREFGGRTDRPSRNNMGNTSSNRNQSFGGRTDRPSRSNMGNVSPDRNQSFGNRTDRPSRSNMGNASPDRNQSFGNRTGSGNMRSSTRTTVERRNYQGTGSFGGRSESGSVSRGSSTAPTRTFTPNRSTRESSAPSRSMSPSRSHSSGSFGSRSTGSGSPSRSNSGGASRSNGGHR